MMKGAVREWRERQRGKTNKKWGLVLTVTIEILAFSVAVYTDIGIESNKFASPAGSILH